MKMIPEIHIRDYDYELPAERIAKYPLPRRDSSKLLVCNADGSIKDSCFKELPDELPAGSLMVRNETKVVPARLFFRRESGAHIEVFCLEPSLPAEYALAFATTQNCRWKCVVGNVKRWKTDEILQLDIEHASSEELVKLGLTARLVSRDARTAEVEFSWKSGDPFSRVLEMCGRIPIPPYLNRETEDVDTERYQTTYARIRGSVAAPTAGLHFTPEVLKAIEERGIDIQSLCLHVGAGTFLPVKSDEISGHKMHREPFSVSIDLLRKLRDVGNGRKTVAVGTTSVRSLESLYYEGVSIIEKGGPAEIGQWDPYERAYPYSREEALDAIVRYLESHGRDSLVTGTRIIIVPGFRFRMTDAMVTNFHQPQSTLLLLISAFLGGDWRSVYKHALDSGYRFLSYGDSSLLFRRENSTDDDK